MKNFCKALIFSLILVSPAFAQHPSVTDINYGNGNIVKETSGNGAPTDVCTDLLRYTQKDATAGQNIWECVSGHMVQQGTSGTSSPATASTFGTVKLSNGQSSTTLSKVATTGVYSDLSGLPTISSYSDFTGSGASHAHGLVPDPGATAGTTRFLREDGTWATTPTGSGAVPGSTPDLYYWDGSQWTRATAAQVQAKLAEDTVNNSSFGFSTGSGGDTTIPTPASGKDFFAMKAGMIQESHNGQAYTPLFVLSCQPGIGDGLNAIPAGTYPVSLPTSCLNKTGRLWTLTSIICAADAGSSTCQVKNGAGTSLLSGGTAITGTSSGAAATQSATTTIADGDHVVVTFVADGTTKQIGAAITGSY